MQPAIAGHVCRSLKINGWLCSYGYYLLDAGYPYWTDQHGLGTIIMLYILSIHLILRRDEKIEVKREKRDYDRELDFTQMQYTSRVLFQVIGFYKTEKMLIFAINKKKF